MSGFMLGVETLVVSVLVFLFAGWFYRRRAATGIVAFAMLLVGVAVFGLFVWQLHGLVQDAVFAALRGAYGGFIAATALLVILWVGRTPLAQWVVRWYTRP